ncbi:MAG: S-adenosylmethionine:tRNA ribosyltransferase-isomerase, partial [Zoogloeaceae bacterium]|nr:S-adenosylmethionine:tRNA ribosyltransferase-isomerase [Zoogloeaceae bacterium]
MIPFTVHDFDFVLPEVLIAQHPASERAASRLLRVGETDVSDLRFADLPRLLNPGDLLVMNDTRVIKARLY